MIDAPKVSDRRSLRDLAKGVSPRAAAMVSQIAVRQLSEDDAWQAARAYATTDDEARRLWARTIAHPQVRNLLQRVRQNEALRLALTPGQIVADALDLFEGAEDVRVKLGCLKVIADLMPRDSLKPPEDAPAREGADAAAEVRGILASYIGADVDLPPARRERQGDMFTG